MCTSPTNARWAIRMVMPHLSSFTPVRGGPCEGIELVQQLRVNREIFLILLLWLIELVTSLV